MRVAMARVLLKLGGAQRSLIDWLLEAPLADQLEVIGLRALLFSESQSLGASVIGNSPLNSDVKVSA